ncbi:MAG TPA: carboxypeptidase-like regulatory domain-containing protein, partial [Pirellulales bacterium]|nr:carboxypeptidase-like regulatory domain-containing protein [Pirellulales bacterium]
LAPIAGCDGAGPKLATVPVGGRVTLDGQPLEGALVAFIPDDANNGKSANGTTDASGNFQLKTLSGGANLSIGALPGDYKVSVAKVPAAGASMPSMGQPGGESTDSVLGAPAGPKPETAASSIPVMYGNPATSGFTATVKPSGNEPFKFELKGQ